MLKFFKSLMELIRYINYVLVDIKICFILLKKMVYVLLKFDNWEERVLRLSFRVLIKIKIIKKENVI